MRFSSVMLLSGALLFAGVSASAQPGKPALREKLSDLVSDGWIYDDIDFGFAHAKKTGRPLLIVFRCVP